MQNDTDIKVITGHYRSGLAGPFVTRHFLYCLAGICLIVMLLSYNAPLPYRNLKWAAGAAWLGISLMLVLNRGALHLTTCQSAILQLLWSFYAFAITPWAYDTTWHLKTIAIVVFYTFSAVFLIQQLNYKPALFAQAILYINILWAFVNSFLLVLFQLNKIEYDFQRFAGTYEGSNHFAVTTTILCGFLLFFKAQLSRKYSRLSSVVIALLIVQIYYTFSIKALLGITFLLFAYALTRIRKIRCTAFYVFIVIGLLVAIFAATENRYRYRCSRFLLNLTNPALLSPDESAYQRIWFIHEGWNLFLKYPLTGVGTNNARYFLLYQNLDAEVAANKIKSGESSHTNYIEMLLNGGTPCFLLYYLPLCYILIQSFVRQNRPGFPVYIVPFLAYKLICDFAFVSYQDFPSIFMLSAVYYSYYRYCRQCR